MPTQAEKASALNKISALGIIIVEDVDEPRSMEIEAEGFKALITYVGNQKQADQAARELVSKGADAIAMLSEEKDRLMEEYGVLRLADEEAAQVEPEAVVARRNGKYGSELLVDRQRLGSEQECGAIGLEDLFIFLTEGSRK